MLGKVSRLRGYQFCEYWPRCLDGTRPVAEAVLHFCAQFRHGQTEIREKENRVVAEAILTALIWDDLARALSFGEKQITPRGSQGNRAVEASRPGAGMVMKALEQSDAPVGVSSAGF